MGGGRGNPIPIFTFTSAIVGIGTTIANAKSNVPKDNFFILLPPIIVQGIATSFGSIDAELAASIEPLQAALYLVEIASEMISTLLFLALPAG